MATYVNDLRLKEIATGDEAGTWGASTNTNLELIAEAFSYGTEASFGSDADATTTIADGSTDPARSLYLKVTSGVSLTATRTLTIAPNTVSKVWIIENATSGSQSINISQGSGANVTIPSGKTKIVYSDGAGSGAAIVDAFASLNLETSGIIETSSSIQTPLIEYTDGDDAITISDGGGTSFAQTLTANAGVSIDNITIDGTEIDLSSGDLTIDVAGNLQIDADDNGEVRFLDGGTQYATIKKDGNNALFQSIVADGDFIIQGIDGASFVSALSFDMSDAGTATFNHDVKLGDNSKAVFGAGDDLQISHDGSNSFIDDTGTGALYIRSNLVQIRKYTGEDMITALADGAVTLYHDNASKLATTSTGVNVTGALTEDSNRVATNGRAIAFSLLF